LSTTIDIATSNRLDWYLPVSGLLVFDAISARRVPMDETVAADYFI
jgi:hypothetical protein